MSTLPLCHNVLLLKHLPGLEQMLLLHQVCAGFNHECVIHLQGVAMFKDRIAAADDPLVQRLKEKGTIIVGG